MIDRWCVHHDRKLLKVFGECWSDGRHQWRYCTLHYRVNQANNPTWHAVTFRAITCAEPHVCTVSEPCPSEHTDSWVGRESAVQRHGQAAPGRTAIRTHGGRGEAIGRHDGDWRRSFLVSYGESAEEELRSLEQHFWCSRPEETDMISWKTHTIWGLVNKHFHNET